MVCGVREGTVVGDFVAAVCLYDGGVRGSGWGVVIGVPGGALWRWACGGGPAWGALWQWACGGGPV